MARHRDVRGLKFEDEIDDGYDDDDEFGSYNDHYGVSPSTEAQFIYSRNEHKFEDYLVSEETNRIPEEADDVDALDNSFKYDLPSLTDVQYAQLLSCLDYVRDVVGESLSDDWIKKSIVDSNFDPEKSLNRALSSKPTGLPMQKPSASKPKGATNTSILPEKKSLAASRVVTSKPAAVFRIGGPAPEAGDDTGRLLSSAADNLGKLNVVPETKVTPKNTPLKSLIGEARSSPSISRSGSKVKMERLDPATEFMKRTANSKEQINLVVVGHVDAGKSTLMGHLLYQLGVVSQRQIHRYEIDSAKQGKGSFMYAWVLDETEEERSRGVTMDIAQSRFETDSKIVHLLDAPGHRDFIPNMITGAAQADCALLVVNATKGEFETGFEYGGQTREHTMLIRSLGVTQVVVAINKMDTVGWSQPRYLEIMNRLALFLKQVGFKESDITYLPCSGLSGVNLTEKNPASGIVELGWYNGPTLIQLIDGFRSPERLINKPLRICVQDIFKGLTGGISIAGRIEAGDIQSGDKVLVMPAYETAFVKTMQVDDESQKIGFAGDYIIMQLQGIDIQKVHVGSFLCDTITPIKIVQKFRARIVVFMVDRPLTKGSPVIVHYQSSNEPAFITRLISQIHKSTGEVVKSRPRCLTKNTSAVIEITLHRAQCLELYQDFKDLGRFMLRIEGKTIAAGQVTEILQTGTDERAAEK